MADYSAATTLDDIINELRLSYDSSVGLLDGDHVQSVPKVSILLNLSKLLNKLNKQFQEIEQCDTEVLEKINEEYGEGDGELEEEDSNENDMEAMQDNEIEEEEVEEEEEEDERAEDDEVANSATTGISKNKERKREVTSDDEDDVGLAKRRKLSKGEVPSLEAEVGDTREEDGDDEQEEEDGVPESDYNAIDKDKPNAEDGIEDGEGDEDDEGHDEDEDMEGEEDEDEEEDEEQPRFDANGDIIPPDQKGHYTQDNDTRLKNPKSEFVTSQTLPAEAIAKLGLFSEGNNGLETHGKEYLKRKYGVASYPENDLMDLLPGPIPSVDFSKNKPPTNQVQFTTFQSYIESYFRPFVPEDIDFLREKTVLPSLPGFDAKSGYDAQTTPFLIPKLGPFYADVWTAEDPSLASKLNTPSYVQPTLENYLPKGSIDNLSDDKLYTEDVSCGPLSSRLLSALLCNNENGELNDSASINGGGDVKMENNDDELTSSPAPQSNGTLNNDDLDVATQLNLNTDTYKVSSEKSDFHSIEERLKRELKYIGIFMNLPNGVKDESSDSLNGNANNSSGGNPSGGNSGSAEGESESEADKKKNTSNIIDNNEWIKNKEDDEVCAEIRALQRELQEVSNRNRQHKKKLISIVEDQLAYQEYCTILEDLDKQVDQAFIKRLKVKNKKKKSTASGTGTSVSEAPPSVNSGLRSLLDKRSKWIDNIGKLFKSPEIMKRAPVESIFVGGVDSDDELDNVDIVEAEESIINK